jgi:hypothetical protein
MAVVMADMTDPRAIDFTEKGGLKRKGAATVCLEAPPGEGEAESNKSIKSIRSIAQMTAGHVQSVRIVQIG